MELLPHPPPCGAAQPVSVLQLSLDRAALIAPRPKPHLLWRLSRAWLRHYGFARDSLRRLLAGRVCPVLQMHRCLGVSKLLKQLIPVGAWRHCRRLFADADSPLRNPVLKGYWSFETMPLLRNGALLSVRGRRERCRAFSSQIKATDRAVMLRICARFHQGARRLFTFPAGTKQANSKIKLGLRVETPSTHVKNDLRMG
jgi:hypothetical protein